MAKKNKSIEIYWLIGGLSLVALLIFIRTTNKGRVEGDQDSQSGNPHDESTVIWVSPVEELPTATPTPTGITNLITPPAAPTATPEPIQIVQEAEPTSVQTSSGGLIQNVINSFSGETVQPNSTTKTNTNTNTKAVVGKPKKVEEPAFKAELVKTQLDLTSESIGNLKQVGLKVPGLVTTIDAVISEHNDFSQKVDAEILRIEGRPKVIKWVLGPNYTALKELNRLIATNAGEIKTLQDLLFKVSDPKDIESIKAAVEAIKTENMAIQEQIDAENSRASVFGFVMRLLAK